VAQSTFDPTNHLYTTVAAYSNDSDWTVLASGLRTGGTPSVYVDAATAEYLAGVSGGTSYDAKADLYSSNASLGRAALGYNTAGLDDSATITSASITLTYFTATYGVFKLYAYTGAWSTSTSNHTAFGTTLLGQVTLAGVGTDYIDLNNDGFAYINKTGSTNFMIRSGYDVDGGTPNAGERLYTSPTYTATLTVNYTVGGTTYTKTVSSKARVKTSGVTKTVSGKARIKKLAVSKNVSSRACLNRTNIYCTDLVDLIAGFGSSSTEDEVEIQFFDSGFNYIGSAAYVGDRWDRSNTEQMAGLYGYLLPIYARLSVYVESDLYTWTSDYFSTGVTDSYQIVNSTWNCSWDLSQAPGGFHVTNILYSVSSAQTGTKTVSSKARVKTAGVTKTISAKSHIEGSISTFTKTVSSKARIRRLGEKTITTQARVKQSSLTKIVSAEARILNIHSETISVKANIIPPTRSKTIGFKASILQTGGRIISAKARVQSAVSRAMQAKARVFRTYVKIISTRARVLLPQGHRSSAKARILFSRGYLVYSRSRIINYTAKVVSSLARVRIASSHVIGAKSRINQVTSHQIGPKANIFNTTTHTVQVKAQVGREGWKYLYAKASIFNVVTRGVSAVARVLVSSGKLTSARARIEVSRIKILEVRSRILVLRSVTVGVKSRIRLGRSQIISVVGRVLIPRSKTAVVKARITLGVSKSVRAKARISHSNSKSITAKSTLLVRTILVTPITETTKLNPITFTWKLYPLDGGSKIISEIMVDDVDDTFSSVESYLSSMDGGFEYFNGDEWVDYPTLGVDIGYTEYEARVTINLSNGTKYWRARIGSK
jgi:hypothetical protein